MKLYQDSYSQLQELRPSVKSLSVTAIFTDYQSERVKASQWTEFVCRWVTTLQLLDIYFLQSELHQIVNHCKSFISSMYHYKQ